MDTAPENPKELAERFDLTALPPGFYADPYPYYRALRQFSPVKRLPDGGVFLTRYADVVAVYKDAGSFSSDKKKEFLPKFGDTPLYAHHTTSLVFNDPPLHTRVRRLLSGALTPRAIADMEGPLTALVDRLLDRMGDRQDVDLIEDFAAAIPVEIIGNLLDVPHAERGPLRARSLAILGALEPVTTPERAERGNRAVTAFSAYLDDLIARRRARPGDAEKDMLTRLIRGEETGDGLSHHELVQNCIFILNAGHETTTNLIGNGLMALLEHPQEKTRLLAAPDLIKTAIEEFLRYESSNQLGNRMTTRDVEIGGEPVAAGSPVHLCIGGANRDAAEFADPERLDIARSPNRHLAFGAGIHQCLGLSLARLEGRVAIGRFLQRFPRYALAGEPLRGGRARFRGFLKLPARLNP